MDNASSSLNASAGVVPRPVPQLERKRSCSDLNSRLKTRKLLGVGQTPDGDVHRSKLSQILGHSEQLYTTPPRGLKIWRYANATVFTLTALNSLLTPSWTACHCLTTYGYSTGQVIGQVASQEDIQGERRVDGGSSIPYRLHGSAVLVLAILLCKSINNTDRTVTGISLLCSAIYPVLHVLLLLTAWLSTPTAATAAVSTWRSCQLSITLLPLLLQTAGSIYFYVRLGEENRPLQKRRVSPSASAPSTSPGRGTSVNQGGPGQSSVGLIEGVAEENFSGQGEPLILSEPGDLRCRRTDNTNKCEVLE